MITAVFINSEPIQMLFVKHKTNLTLELSITSQVQGAAKSPNQCLGDG